jgi:hypothetical protein
MLANKNPVVPSNIKLHQTMKSLVHLLRCTSLLTLLTALPSSALADLTWGGSGAGGAGTWNDSNTNWWNGTTDVAWDSTGATFAGTAGIVAVSGTQNVTSLALNTAFYTLQGGIINFTGGSPTLGGSANGQTISSVLQSASGLNISGGGKTISGNNADLDGIININGTVVRLGNNNALGDSSALADRVVLQNGAILQLNAGITLSKYITTSGTAVTIESIGNSSITGTIAPTTSLFLQLDPGSTLTLSGNAGIGQTTSAIQTVSTGRLVLDAVGGSSAIALQIRGSTTVQANNVANVFGAVGTNIFMGEVAGDPTLALNGSTISNNLFLYGASATRKIENMSAGTSTYAGQILAQANVSTILRSTTTGTLRITGNINDTTFTGGIEIGTSTHLNSGIVEFARAAGNAYDGGTTVNSGTLLVSNTSGSATGTGAVTVNNGGSLIGGGIITGDVTVNSGGTISGGTTVGVLRTGNLSLASGSSMAVQIDSLTAGTGYDQISVTGAVSLAGDLAITLNFVPVQDSLFFILLNDGGDAITGVLGGHAQGDIFSMAGYNWSISYQGDFATNSFTGGNDVVLRSLDAVPEPSTYALIGLGAIVGLCGWRRKAQLVKRP